MRRQTSDADNFDTIRGGLKRVQRLILEPDAETKWRREMIANEIGAMLRLIEEEEERCKTSKR